MNIFARINEWLGLGGMACPKCGERRVPWREGNWACWVCDLVPPAAPKVGGEK